MDRVMLFGDIRHGFTRLGCFGDASSGPPPAPSTIWLIAAAWLAILPAALGAITLSLRWQRGSSAGAALVLLVLAGLHLAYWRRPWPVRQERAAAVITALLALLAIAAQRLLASPQPLLWIYPAMVAGLGLRSRWAAVAIALITAIAAVQMTAHGATLPAPIQVANLSTRLLPVPLVGFSMAAVRQLIGLNAKLAAMRADLAELCVVRERDRLARDLHDLLGRTLSTIAVKAELAARLSDVPESGSVAEMRRVQALARQALQDVRDAIAGWRLPALISELAAARSVLSDAGIEVTLLAPAGPLPPAYDATLAWVVREAATNVLRHSAARHCRITLQTAPAATVLEISDDGRGRADAQAGNGLRGIAERVDAVGGSFVAGPGENGGYRLRVELPAPASGDAKYSGGAS